MATVSEPSESGVSPVGSSNPLLKRAQDALLAQAARRKLEAEEGLYEARNRLKAASAEREATGVELFSVQQQLAALAEAEAAAAGARDAVAEDRARIEASLADATAAHATLAAETATRRKEARGEA